MKIYLFHRRYLPAPTLALVRHGTGAAAARRYRCILIVYEDATLAGRRPLVRLAMRIPNKREVPKGFKGPLHYARNLWTQNMYLQRCGADGINRDADVKEIKRRSGRWRAPRRAASTPRRQHADTREPSTAAKPIIIIVHGPRQTARNNAVSFDFSFFRLVSLILTRNPHYSFAVWYLGVIKFSFFSKRQTSVLKFAKNWMERTT